MGEAARPGSALVVVPAAGEMGQQQTGPAAALRLEAESWEEFMSVIVGGSTCMPDGRRCSA